MYGVGNEKLPPLFLSVMAAFKLFGKIRGPLTVQSLTPDILEEGHSASKYKVLKTRLRVPRRLLLSALALTSTLLEV